METAVAAAAAVRRPRPALRPWISGLWLSAAHPVAESVLPAGRAQLVVALGPGTVGAMVHGPASRVREVGATRGTYLGVQFHAGGTGPFFAVPADALADRPVPLEELWGGPARRLVERLMGCAEPGARLDLIEDVLVERCAGARVPALLEVALRALQAGCGVGAVASACGVDRRVLAAVFRREVGFGPKRYARLARFERAVRDLRAPGAPSLAVVAARHGFADQPHLTREFGGFAGVPPGRLHRVPGPTALHVLHDETVKTAGRGHRRLGA